MLKLVVLDFPFSVFLFYSLNFCLIISCPSCWDTVLSISLGSTMVHFKFISFLCIISSKMPSFHDFVFSLSHLMFRQITGDPWLASKAYWKFCGHGAGFWEGRIHPKLIRSLREKGNNIAEKKGWKTHLGLQCKSYSWI